MLCLTVDESASASDDTVSAPEPPANGARLPGSSLSISNLSFPGKDAGAGVAGALEIDRGVAGPLDVCVASVESDASDADGASVALSAVGGGPGGFLSDERAGGGGSTIADMEARRASGLGRESTCPCVVSTFRPMWRWGWE